MDTLLETLRSCALYLSGQAASFDFGQLPGLHDPPSLRCELALRQSCLYFGGGGCALLVSELGDVADFP